MKPSKRAAGLIAGLSIWALVFSPILTTAAEACTGLAIKAADGTYISGRTAEFGVDLKLGVLYAPRDMAFQGTLPDGSAGLKYTSKYALIGANAYDERSVLDGLNEKGLAVGGFYFPGFAGYADVTAENSAKGLSATEFPTWLLSQFATVDEVRQGLAQAAIVKTVPAGWGDAPPPFHYVVYDASGKSIVIEPVGGVLKVYDNPVGVMTNSPTFDWHLVNLNNYVNLSPLGVTPKKIDGMTLQAMSTGSGLHGLPGDFSSPSRFVRAAIFSATAVPEKTGQDALAQAFHLLNQFDIPPGAVRTPVDKSVQVEWTLATVVRDPKTLTLYVKTFDDQSVRKISLNDLDPNGKGLIKFGLGGKEQYRNLAPSGVKYSRAD